MGDIYTKAEYVVAYLGEATPASDQFMDFSMLAWEIELQSPRAAKAFDDFRRMDDSTLEGLREILSRPWFQRVWVIQEVLNARNAVLYCGSKAVSSDVFVRACEMLLHKDDHLRQGVLDFMPGHRRDDRGTSKSSLYDLLLQFKHLEAADSRDRIFALLSMVDNRPSEKSISPDYSMSERDLIRVVIAKLCFCELSSVPTPPYDTIDELISNLNPIDNGLVGKILEVSQDIDLEALLQYGSRYIRIDHFLVESASRNKTKGNEMVKLLLNAIGQERSSSPTPSEVSSVFSDISAPSTNTSLPEDVRISVWHVVEILLAQDAFVDLCQRGFHREDLEPARFTNSLRRMLRTFGRTLLSEGQSYATQLAAQLILDDSRHMAALIRARYDPSYERIGSKLIHSGLDSMTESERRSRIESFIQQLTSANTEATKESVDAVQDNNDADNDAYTALHEESTGISSLDEIENFIPSSQAFGDLLDSLNSFLKLPRPQDKPHSAVAMDRVQSQHMAQVPLNTDLNEPFSRKLENPREISSIDLPNLELPKNSFWSWVYETLSNWLTVIEPLKPGLRRIQYRCVRSSCLLCGGKYI